MVRFKKPSGGANANDASAGERTIDPNDPLGYDVYAETLWSRIKHALDRDPHDGNLGDDPLVVGLFGEWGVGKSYLLDKIHTLASEHQKELSASRRLDGGFDLLIPVAFQPWKYEHEEHLHVPILLHVLAALEAGISDALTFWETAAGKAQKPGDTIIKAMPKVVSLFKKAVFGTAVVFDPTATAALASAQALADHATAEATKRKASEKPSIASQLKYTGDGRYYYEINKILKAVCRPGKYPDLQGHKLLNDVFRVNFVIFVDDLDRCLPEKAVAVLELIKTIFNVESFAFVLALDEEVIERGIGHRYREYQLADKKSQMPITGFEYLEKIVHLPFRLPALTERQATRFVAMVEELIEPTESQRWFWQFRSENMVGLDGLHTMSVNELPPRMSASRNRQAWWLASEGRVDERSPQLRLLLNAFDAYVPRKLRRILELWHQICDVNWAREDVFFAKARLTWRRIGSKGDAVYLDTRVVFSLALLQLFQPELFRFMRRRIEAFPALLGAFLGANDGFKGAQQSDIELWSWASHRQASARAGDKSKPRSEQEALVRIAQYQDSGDDYATARAYIAQRVRMGLAERLVEHFAAQRHVFNPLKMFQELAGQIGKARFDEIVNTGFAPYFSALAQVEMDRGLLRHSDLRPFAESVMDIQPTNDRLDYSRYFTNPSTFDLADPDSLYEVLVSPDAAGRANIRERFGLQDGREISVKGVDRLCERFSANSRRIVGSGDNRRLVVRMLEGVRALAPWLRWESSGYKLLFSIIGTTLPSPVGVTTETLLHGLFEAAREPRVRAMIGDTLNRFPAGDPRFDAGRYYLLKDRFAGHDLDQEPLYGFVRVPAGSFAMGRDSQSAEPEPNLGIVASPSRLTFIESPFYIARMLTTVDQFARFVEDGGHVDAILEDVARGRSSETLGDSEWRVPLHWDEQRAYGNRPVVGVTWFQARAYARWLDKKLKADADDTLVPLPSGYAVRLPNEAQWERAARATGFGATDISMHPWPNAATEGALKDVANIQDTLLGRVSSVGVFPPTEIGLTDFAGNVCEWTDNAAVSPVAGSFFAISDAKERALLLERTGRVSLRGGSAYQLARHAAASHRNWSEPGLTTGDFGFRVALSLSPNGTA